MRKSRIAIAAIAALSIVAASCGSDSDSSDTTTAPAESTAPAETTGATTAPADTTAVTEAASGSLDLDTNGDGKVQFGIAAGTHQFGALQRTAGCQPHIHPQLVALPPENVGIRELLESEGFTIDEEGLQATLAIG